ncbi:nickel/cobalt transporter [Desulfovibrio sp. Fe33]|uniref:nickel/cobalt transporter n=1 Tax=Desulfovibrio sp. Fe33 TaxID=3020842 RepID=UPI00234C8FC6|nr:hypothetical protein [Desulfovibrio sp. Fe33]
MRRQTTLPALLLGLILTGLMFAGPAPMGMAGTGLAAPNPFTSASGTNRAESPENGLFSPLAPVMKEIASWQNTLRQAMSRSAESIRENPLGKAFWLFMGLAFAYGAAHALGPGHGKVLAASYFLYRDAPPRQALIYAYLSMPLHVLSATVLVLGGKYLFKMSASRAVDDMGLILQNISYGLLATMGLFMLAGVLRNCRNSAPAPSPRQKNNNAPKSLVGLALATGLVPCPGAALVLIFSISLGITPAGVAAMVAIALGMGLCLAAVSLLTIKFRDTALALMQTRSPLLRAGQCLLSLAGAFIVFATGSLLLLGSLLNLA